MDKINLHGVSIRVSAFKSAKDVKDAKLFAHLSNSAAKETELIAALGLAVKPVKTPPVAQETPTPEAPQTEKPA